MKLELYCQNSETGILYNIAELVGDIKISTEMYGNPGKMTFTCQRDPNGLLKLANGSKISFLADDIGVFTGRIFTLEADQDDIYSVTAYDQMRYLKNKEVYQTSGQTASQIFEQVCKDLEIEYRVSVPSSHVPEEFVHDNKTFYQVIEYGILRSNIYEDDKHYFIRDDYGVLEFTELGQRKTNLIIGENSLMTNYKYTISTDKESYNTVKLYRENKETGKRDVWMVFDSYNQGKWGLLQFLKKADDNYNEARIRELADNYLKLYNRETQTLKLSGVDAHDNPVAHALTAGSGFRVSIPLLGIEQDMWVTKATHNYDYELHTMDLEVFI